MSHFAIPGDDFLPKDEFVVPILDEADMMLDEGIQPLGLSLVSKDLTFALVIFALAVGVDAADWWSR